MIKNIGKVKNVKIFTTLENKWKINVFFVRVRIDFGMSPVH